MFRKKSEPHPAAAPVFSQYSKEAILQLELLPGVSATEVTVAFELQCVTVTQQWSKSEEPMVQTVPLPRKVKVEECWCVGVGPFFSQHMVMFFLKKVGSG
jgi:hypothetical protein